MIARETFCKKSYNARVAQCECVVEAAQKLRYRTFCSNGRTAAGVELDRDRYDLVCQYILTEDRSSGGLVCWFRILPISDTMPINANYSAQFYQLLALKQFQGGMVEMGQFCIAPAIKDPDILRLAWAVISRYVAQNNIRLLFGRSSFSGLDTGQYLDAFALLKARYLGARALASTRMGSDVFCFAARLGRGTNMKLVMARLPPC